MSRKTRGKTSAAVIHTARRARLEPTPAESKLWQALRGRRLTGLRFRRQHPSGQFILDSFCVERQPAIEIDGEVHCNPDQIAHDQARSEILATHGIRILRFTNHRVLNKVDDVLNEIQKATTF